MAATVTRIMENGQGHMEAPVSMNAFIDVPGVGKVQVTARGASGLEAATNLQHSIDALAQVYQPVPEPTREERLAGLLATGILTAVQRGNGKLRDRLIDGFDLAVRGLVEAQNGHYTVRSQEKLDTWYTIKDAACSCPDWQRKAAQSGGAMGYRCKHLLAVCFMVRLGAMA